METNLIPIEHVNAIELFSSEKSLTQFLKMIEKEATSFVPDTTTKTGRDEIKSKAYAVARSKTVIDDAGKSLTEEWARKKKEVDEGRKRARDFCDDLKERVREPLTTWEAEEAKRAEELAKIAKMQADEIEAYAANDLFDREAKVRAWEKQQAEEAEAKRITEAKEREAKERAEREARIALEAEERARKQAEAQIEAEKRRRIEAEERAKREAQEAADRESRLRAEAEERAKREAIEAARKAEREKTEAIQQERDRVERERAQEAARQRAEDERKRKTAHVNKIQTEAVKSLIKEGFHDAEAIVSAIAGGMIAHVRIEY